MLAAAGMRPMPRRMVLPVTQVFVEAASAQYTQPAPRRQKITLTQTGIYRIFLFTFLSLVYKMEL